MRTITLAACALVLTGAAEASAQGYPPSQRQIIAQNVARTRIEIEYGRPVARGRELWGKLVPWDSIWHPGADSASRMSFDHDIIVEGKTLKAGEYTLWLIPRDGKPWTVIFSRAAHVFHKPYPGAGDDVLRVDVNPETASHVESMTIDFPAVLRDEATLRIQWGTTAVPIHLKAPWKPE